MATRSTTPKSVAHCKTFEGTHPAILLVQEDGRPRRALSSSLRGCGYRVIASDGEAVALRVQRDESPDLVLVDFDLPGVDGLHLTRAFRECSAVPIVVLSTGAQEDEVVDALDSGADEYLHKPVREKELQARIRVCLRSFSRRGGSRRLSVGAIHVDPALRDASVHGRRVTLSDTEYRLLGALVRGGGGVVTHEQLLESVWGQANTDNICYLRVYVRALRRKLEPSPARPQYLLTEPGIGYRLSALAPDAATVLDLDVHSSP